MADMLTPVWLDIFPEWLRAISNGLMTGAFFVVILMCGGLLRRGRELAAIILMSLCLFTLRWDALWMEFCASYNYVWSTVFALSAILLIFRSDRLVGWLALLTVPFCALAGSMHEASGIPLAAGCLVQYMIDRDRFRSQSWIYTAMMWSFVAGGIFTLCSPSAYSRVGMLLQPEPLLSVIAGSGFYVVILIAVLVILAILFYNRHDRLQALILAGVPLWSIAALLSAAFMVISGYGGRTGWFAQIFAMIALARIWCVSEPAHSYTKKRYLTTFAKTFLCVIIIAHCIALIIAQRKLTSEVRDVIKLFDESESGLVYYDPTPDHAMPWWLLAKTHGVPDADDTFYISRFSEWYGRHGADRTLLILPTAWQEIDMDTVSSELRMTDGYGDIHLISSDYLPVHPMPLISAWPRYVAIIDSTLCIRTPVPGRQGLYYYTTLHEDRGEK